MPKGTPLSSDFKFKVALEAAKGTKTLPELCREFGLHPSQISAWKVYLMQHGATLFQAMTDQEKRDQAALQTELYEQLGRLQMELEWLKKKAAK
jgi:transposase-like protein